MFVSKIDICASKIDSICIPSTHGNCLGKSRDIGIFTNSNLQNVLFALNYLVWCSLIHSTFFSLIQINIFSVSKNILDFLFSFRRIKYLIELRHKMYLFKTLLSVISQCGRFYGSSFAYQLTNIMEITNVFV